MAHLASVPDSIDGKDKAMLFIVCVFRQHGLQLAIISDRDLASPLNFGLPSSRCLARDWTCPQRIIRRPIIRRSELIASSAMFFAVFVLSRHGLGARCSLSLSLRRTTLSMPRPALLPSMRIFSSTPAFRSRSHYMVLGLVGESLLTRLLKSALPRRRNK